MYLFYRCGKAESCGPINESGRPAGGDVLVAVGFRSIVFVIGPRITPNLVRPGLDF